MYTKRASNMNQRFDRKRISDLSNRIDKKRFSDISHRIDKKRDSSISHTFDRKNRMKKSNVSQNAVSMSSYSPTFGPVEGRFAFDPFRSISHPRAWDPNDQNPPPNPNDNN